MSENTLNFFIILRKPDKDFAIWLFRLAGVLVSDLLDDLSN